jgi:hypothetical protein
MSQRSCVIANQAIQWTVVKMTGASIFEVQKGYCKFAEHFVGKVRGPNKARGVLEVPFCNPPMGETSFSQSVCGHGNCVFCKIGFVGTCASWGHLVHTRPPPFLQLYIWCTVTTHRRTRTPVCHLGFEKNSL